jgi:hypothetical protein
MQTLNNGGYLAIAGWSLPLVGRSTEFDKDGKVVLAMDIEGAVDYRSYRVPDMYSAPTKQ